MNDKTSFLCSSISYVNAVVIRLGMSCGSGRLSEQQIGSVKNWPHTHGPSVAGVCQQSVVRTPK